MPSLKFHNIKTCSESLIVLTQYILNTIMFSGTERNLEAEIGCQIWR